MGSRVSGGKLRAKEFATQAISPEIIMNMFKLFSRFYEDISFSQFCLDLKDKDHVILAFDKKTDDLKGFTTIKVYKTSIANRSVNVLYSGDTIVDPQYWGQTALHKALFNYVLKLKLKEPLRPLYWFLISKGYKTYLGLARNVPEHWPRYDKETPAFEKSLMNHLARERFQESWREDLGVLKFSTCKGRLKVGVACVENNLLGNPQIKFFHDRNPGHMQGDELCCLGKLDSRLVIHFSWRTLKKSFKWLRPRIREGYVNVAKRPT